VIELLDFNLRGGRDAPSAAARVARITERYLTKTAAHDIMAVVNEIVAWLGTREPMPRTLRLELSVTSTVVRVSVTAAPRRPASPAPTTNRMVRQTLPVTAALASRYGLEASRRTRVWAEFDRCDEPVAAYTEPQYSS
jgi:hypothetical protein